LVPGLRPVPAADPRGRLARAALSGGPIPRRPAAPSRVGEPRRPGTARTEFADSVRAPRGLCRGLLCRGPGIGVPRGARRSTRTAQICSFRVSRRNSWSTQPESGFWPEKPDSGCVDHEIVRNVRLGGARMTLGAELAKGAAPASRTDRVPPAQSLQPVYERHGVCAGPITAGATRVCAGPITAGTTGSVPARWRSAPPGGWQRVGWTLFDGRRSTATTGSVHARDLAAR
ncbi:MAG: hypothetical protein QOI68_430, partial [Pseudonocardiales bacterium]|nr:hypothetical protein [Pseudonocardiales bacterium]